MFNGRILQLLLRSSSAPQSSARRMGSNIERLGSERGAGAEARSKTAAKAEQRIRPSFDVWRKKTLLYTQIKDLCDLFWYSID